MAGATARCIAAATGMTVTAAGPALAHTSERGHVMLLPTGYYLIGGALAVALSFLVLALVRPEPLERLAKLRLPLASVGERGRAVVSLAGLAVLVLLVATGFWGSRDPLSNPLPLTVWTLFWVGLTLLQGLVGDLWAWFNPWYGPYRLMAARGWAPRPRHLPDAFGYWPAIFIFFAFAWFELIYPAPDDPWRLAVVAALYWLGNFAAILVFGYEAWMRRGEIFSVFFGMVSRLAVFGRSLSPGPAKLTPVAESGETGNRLSLSLPGARLVDAPVLPVSGALFLLLALASVSFDGLMRTFFWLGLNGVNPLEFPGRTAMIGVNGAGLLLAFLTLSAAFFAAVIAGHRMAGADAPFPQAAGALVWSIIPISLAYHFSHYLTAFLVNGQYALAALSDPFARGWDLLGAADAHIHAGVVAGHEAARAIWNAQAAAIVAGHVLAVVAAHAIAFRVHGSRRAAVVSQAPLAAMMVAYTLFGLWLLSTPTAG